MNRSFVWGVPTAVVAVLALIISLNNAAGPGPGTATGIAGGPQGLSVTLEEYEIAPASLTAAPGSPIAIQVSNAGALDHDFAVVGEGKTELIASSQSAVLQLPAMAPGSYQFMCTVPGHAELGMTGTLEVSEGASPPAAGPVAEPMKMTAEEMDASYLAGIKAFLDDKPPTGGQPLQPRTAGGVKVFEVTAEEIDWEVAPGEVKKAMAYNRQIPGPEIRAKLGERVRIVLRNRLHESTAIHFHGLEVPNDQDGVPGLTEDAVKSGEDKTYEFDVPNAGSHIYHAHMAAQRQVPLGLLGAFIVEGPDDPEVDLDYTMVLNDGPLGFTINGRGFPWTEAVVAKPGQTMRIRYLNEGLQGHPMHLHGMNQQVIALDGWPVPAPWRRDTVWVAPGQRVDVLVTTRPGLWAFHCHILTHAEADTGYIGMTTVMVVQ